MSKHNFGDDMSPAEIEILQAQEAQQTVSQQEAAVQAEQQATQEEEQSSQQAATEQSSQGGEVEPGTEAEAPAAETAPTEGESASDKHAAEDLNQDAIEAVLKDDQPAPYQVGDIAAMEAKRKELRNQEADIVDKIQEVRDKWNQGDLSDDEKDTQIKALRTQASELRDQQDELLQDVSAQRALASANAQRESAAQLSILQQIAKGAAGVIDYSNPAIATQFDAQLRVINADPELSSKPFAERAQKAHELVCVLNGKTPTAPAPSPAPAPAPTPSAAPAPAARRDVPTTLGSIPAAGAAPVGNDFLSQFEGLGPDEAEAMMESMPTAARTNAFRATVRG